MPSSLNTMDSEMSNKYPIGSEPKIVFIPYLIFCSYLVSLIGAFTTVELLHRRISGTGWQLWVQLAGCAVSFGGVAIWCMHFVGNRAIILGDGEGEIQLYYSSTFTVISFIMPVIVLFVGFLIADRFYKGSKHPLTRFCSLLVCGICAGASIVEMHYLGNYGTSDFKLHLSWPHVGCAAVIAVGASILSFGLFFHWSGHWMNNIWRRIVVACFLALAVSGMHWTAAAGTKYEITGYHKGPIKERDVTLIMAISLCLSSCVVVFLLGFLKQRHRKMLKERAQQFVLAVVTFDAEGRLLVSQGGLLPCQTITRQFHQKTFDDEFNTSHPVFHWIFRISRNWSGIVDLIPSMRDHLQATGYLQTPSPIMGSGTRTSIGSENDSGYSVTFRELFCVTAYEIAKSLDTGLQNLGSLYEGVFTTGTLSSRTIFKDTRGNKSIIAADVATSQKDVEAGIVNPILFGKMLVITKKVDISEANRLQNLGYRFANMEQIGEHLASSLQVPREDLETLVDRLYAYSQREPSIPASGTFLASFLIQPSPSMRGLDVIVPKQTPDRLPMVKLSDGELSDREAGLLAKFNGRTLDECLVRAGQPSGSITDNVFMENFRNKILDLLRDSPEAELHRAIFSSQKINMAHGLNGPKELSQATVFAFCGIKEIYIQSLQSDTLKTIPISLFQTYLRSYPGCPDHAILAHKNHKEFSSLLQSTSMSNSVKSSKLPRLPGSRQGNRLAQRLQFTRSSSMERMVRSECASEKGSVVSPVEAHGSHFWGGIMVTSQQNMMIDDSKKDDGSVEMHDMGVRTEAGVADSEQQTLADRLMSITTSFRDPHASRAPAKDLHYGRQ